MSSLVKWIIGGIAVLVLLIVIIMISIPFFIDPNDYKDKITRTVQEQTGRELSIPGDIKLSVSPALKAVFRLGSISLSSGRDFQDTEFFSSELVDINLALWPLISSKTLQVDNITLKGVNVNLVRKSSGAANWQDFTGDRAKESAKQEAPPAGKEQPAAKPAKALPKIDIGGIKITDTNVTYTDQKEGRTVKLSNFNLNVGHLVEGNPFPFDAGFSLSMDDGRQPLTAATDLKGSLTFDLGRLLFIIDQLKLNTDITGAPVPVKVIGLEMSAEADLDKSRINVSGLRMNIDDTTITGTASITDLQKPSYKAALHIDQLNLDRYKTAKEKPATAVAEAPEATQSASTAAAPQQ
jgi:AsmA protein